MSGDCSSLSEQDHLEEETTGSEEEDSDSEQEGEGHFSAYLCSLKQGVYLRDLAQGIAVDTFVAVSPATKIPWLARVVQLDDRKKSALVRWFHPVGTTHKKFTFVRKEQPAWVDYGDIVCNGLCMQPQSCDPYIWKLITPMAFIRELNEREVAMSKAYPNLELRSHIKQTDITGIQFATAKDFKKFLLGCN